MIFAKAIRRQADTIEENALHADYKRDVKRMRVAASLIERYGKDEYGDKILDDIAEKYDWSNRNMFKKEKDEAECRELRRLFDYEEYMRKQDIKLFGEYLRKYLRGWWD
jgi:hypothetical protein